MTKFVLTLGDIAGDKIFEWPLRKLGKVLTIEIEYSETCLKRTPWKPIFLSALDRWTPWTGYVCETLTSKLILGAKYFVRFKQVSALEHVRFRQVLLYTRREKILKWFCLKYAVADFMSPGGHCRLVALKYSKVFVAL